MLFYAAGTIWNFEVDEIIAVWLF